MFWGKIFPGVFMANTYVGRLTPDEAANLLLTKTQVPENIILKNGEQDFEIPLKFVDFSYDFNKSAQRAYDTYRTGNYLYDQWHRLQSSFNKVHLGLRINIDEEKLAESLSVIAGQVSVEPVYPSVAFVNEEIVVDRGSHGVNVDIEKLRLSIGQNLTFAKNSPISIPTYIVDPSLLDEEFHDFNLRAEKLVGKFIELEFENQTFIFNEKDIFNLLDPHGKYTESSLNNLVDNLSREIDHKPQNPVFTFESGKVKEFAPAKDGVSVNKEELHDLITEGLTRIETSDEISAFISIPATSTPPDYRTEDVNDLGIKELIGKGSSRFSGSISSRIYNISVASGRLNGTLVKPGETMSFNGELGDVSEETGYKQAYIIQDGKTILGDGGGVCQVSTTLFRAALDAGLPIIERQAHAYRVSYYEQGFPPGLDATVYSPTTDLKIKNDTPGHILIQTIYNPSALTLTFEIYGTDDGRLASTTKPVVTNVTPPPEDLYIDDPTKPIGTIEQIDWQAWGARVWFDYVVERDGEVVYEKTFYSNFKPWQAKYLRGIAPAE